MLCSSCERELKKNVGDNLQTSRSVKCYTCQTQLSLQPVEEDAGGNIAPWRPPSHSRWTCLEGSCSRGEPMNEQFSWQELWPVRDLLWSSLFLKDRTLWKGATLEQTEEDCILRQGPTVEQGKGGQGRNSTKDGMRTDHDPH